MGYYTEAAEGINTRNRAILDGLETQSLTLFTPYTKENIFPSLRHSAIIGLKLHATLLMTLEFAKSIIEMVQLILCGQIFDGDDEDGYEDSGAITVGQEAALELVDTMTFISEFFCEAIYQTLAFVINALTTLLDAGAHGAYAVGKALYDSSSTLVVSNH